MKVKEHTKWPLLLILTIIIYYLSVYIPLFLTVISIFCLITGLYILIHPGAFSKSNPETFELFQNELNQKLKGHENLVNARKKELLADYKGQLIINTYLVGVPILITFCLALYGVSISKHMWYEYLLIFFLLIVLILHENNTFKYIPSSRYNRTRLNFFIQELESNKATLNGLNKPPVIVNNIELNHSEINHDHSQIVYENRVIAVDNARTQIVNKTHAYIDNRVINNDNRVLQNNFVTTIDNSKKETPQLNIESIFWKFIKLENGEQDVLLKYHRLTGVIHELNSRLFKIDKKEFFHISDNKIHFFSASPPKVLAEFTKYLIIEKYLDEEISYTNNRKYLLDIFEVPGGTPFKHFQNAIWKDIDRKNIIFYT